MSAILYVTSRWMKVGYKDTLFSREEIITLVRDPEHVRGERSAREAGRRRQVRYTLNRRVEHRSRAEVELSRWR